MSRMILLVEDNPGDVHLIQEALQGETVGFTIQVAANGIEALAFLQRTGKYAAAVRPDLVLLDLNLPRMGGLEALAAIKGDPVLRRIPVIVLTGSRSEQDVNRAYDLHANCYIAKPLDLDSFFDMARKVREFWFSIVSLPNP